MHATLRSHCPLPEDWQSDPAPDSTRQLGLDWLRRQETFVKLSKPDPLLLILSESTLFLFFQVERDFLVWENGLEQA